MKAMWILIFLASLLAAGGISVTSSSYKERELTANIQNTKAQYNNLQLEWSQLILEESTLSDEAIIYTIAENKLDMNLPTTKHVVYKH